MFKTELGVSAVINAQAKGMRIAGLLQKNSLEEGHFSGDSSQRWDSLVGMGGED